MGNRLLYEADVAVHARAAEVVRAVHADFGRIDALVNNAGRGNPKGITEITEEEFDRTIAVNLKSCFNFTQPVVPIMQAAGGGRIISMSSLNAFTGGVTSAVSKFSYGAAKPGILGMTRALAKELGPTIAINAICPGVIETEGLHATGISGSDFEKQAVAQTPLGRVGQPQDIAPAVVFLASAGYITGEILTIAGGLR